MIIDLEKENLTINAALFIAKENDVLKLGNKTYNEQVEVSIKNLTFIGSENTIIENDYHSGMIVNGKKIGTTTSATFRILEEAINTKIYNITFKNNHVRIPGSGNGQAVAFKSEAFNTYIENCKFISRQDTFYMDFGTNNIVKDSYIEGDIDFIFGSADCVFYNCKFHTVDTNKLAYFIAPSTIITNNYGFIFYKCEFYTDFKCDLGRGWFPSKATSPVYPKTSIIDSKLIGDINPNLVLMHQVDLGKEYSLKINNSYLNGNLLGNDNVEEELKYIKELF